MTITLQERTVHAINAVDDTTAVVGVSVMKVAGMPLQATLDYKTKYAATLQNANKYASGASGQMTWK